MFADQGGGFSRGWIGGAPKSKLVRVCWQPQNVRNIQRANPRFAHISQSICRHVGVSCSVLRDTSGSALTALCEASTFCDLTKMLRRYLPRPCFEMGLDARESRIVSFCACSSCIRVATDTSGKIMRPYHSCSVDRNLSQRWLTSGLLRGVQRQTFGGAICCITAAHSLRCSLM